MPQSKSTKSQTTTNNEDIKGALSGIVLAPGQVISGVDKTGKQASYEIRNYLGEGWTAVVYAGMNMVSKQLQLVALKVLRPNSDKLTIDNFRGEKEILDEIRAQNVTCVPEVYGLFVNIEQNLEFIAMEFVSESDYPRLDNILEFQGLLNEEDVLEISRQAVILLDRLHTRVNRTYTDMQLKDFCWNAPARKLMVIDWNHVSFERAIIEAGKQNNPSVKQQLQARGAEDFDGLARLDVRRFATYIYTLLTGKQVLEVGETSWGLKARAGGHWDRISESIRLIIFKALVSYPGLQPYQSSEELLKDIESAIALAKRKDIEHLTDELGRVLDEVEDNDGLADTDEQIKNWVPQRLEKINRASALLNRVRSLPEAQDLILQKRLMRYEERIASLFDGVPDNWATGQRYFDVEQYLTALDLWEPLAEKRQTVHLWRQILLARAASNVSNFAQMKTYLEEALRNLKNGEIENALLQFNSGVAGAREIPDALAVIKSELVALHNIKKASEARSFNEVEAFLKKTEHVLKEREVPYIDILMRDPVWFGYVGSWLSEKDKDVFYQLGQVDIFAVIRNRLTMLKAQTATEADEKKKFDENFKLIGYVVENFEKKSQQDSLELLRDRLWGKPDDESLFKAVCHVFDNFLRLEKKKENQEKFAPVFRQIFYIALQWGAPSEAMEEILRSHLHSLDILVYTNELDISIINQAWHSAEEAARRLVLLLGQAVGEIESVRNLEREFWKRVEPYREIIAGNDLVKIFDTGIDDLIHFDNVLNTLTAPDKAKREKLFAEIAEKRNQAAKIKTEIKERKKEIEIGEKQIQEEIIVLAAQSASLEADRKKLFIKTGLITTIGKEFINKDESILPDYRNIINIINGHIQEVRSQYQKPTPDLEDWLKTWTKYKEDLEEIMKQQRLFAEFKQSLRNCVLAVAVWDQNQAKDHLKISQEKLNQLTSEYALMGKELYGNASGICNKLGDNKTEFDNLLTGIKSFENSNDNNDVDKLQTLRQKCDELLRIQLEHAGKLADVFPQFAYLRLNSLDRQIDNLQLRSRIIQFSKANVPDIAYKDQSQVSIEEDINKTKVFSSGKNPSDQTKTSSQPEVVFESDGKLPSIEQTAGKDTTSVDPLQKKNIFLRLKEFFSSTLGKWVIGIASLVILAGTIFIIYTNFASILPFAQATETPTHAAEPPTQETEPPTQETELPTEQPVFTETPQPTFTPIPIFFGKIIKQNGFRGFPPSGGYLDSLSLNDTIEIIGVTKDEVDGNKWYLIVYKKYCGWTITASVELNDDVVAENIPQIEEPYLKTTTETTPDMCVLSSNQNNKTAPSSENTP